MSVFLTGQDRTDIADIAMPAFSVVEAVVGLLRCVDAVLTLGPWPQLLLVASGSGAPHTQEQIPFYACGRESAITAAGRKQPETT